MINKISIIEPKSTVKYFLRASTQKLHSRGSQDCFPCWKLNLTMCRNFSHGTGFSNIEGWWAAAKSWHCERPGKITDEGVALIAEEI